MILLFGSSLQYRSALVVFRKPTRPSLPLRKAPPLISVFSPQGRRGKPPSGAQNRFALRLADHQRSSPYYAGWDRLDITCYYLAIVYYLLKVVGTTPILKPPCLVISHKESVTFLMYKDESSSHHRLSSYPYPRKTFHNDHQGLL